MSIDWRSALKRALDLHLHNCISFPHVDAVPPFPNQPPIVLRLVTHLYALALQ